MLTSHQGSFEPQVWFGCNSSWRYWTISGHSRDLLAYWKNKQQTLRATGNGQRLGTIVAHACIQDHKHRVLFLILLSINPATLPPRLSIRYPFSIETLHVLGSGSKPRNSLAGWYRPHARRCNLLDGVWTLAPVRHAAGIRNVVIVHAGDDKSTVKLV